MGAALPVCGAASFSRRVHAAAVQLEVEDARAQHFHIQPRRNWEVSYGLIVDLHVHQLDLGGRGIFWPDTSDKSAYEQAVVSGIV